MLVYQRVPSPKLAFVSPKNRPSHTPDPLDPGESSIKFTQRDVRTRGKSSLWWKMLRGWGVHNAVRNRPPWDHMGKLNQIEWANGVSGTGVKHKDHGRCYSDTSSLAFWIFLASFSHSQCGGRLLLVGSALAPRPPPGEASARPVAQWKKMRAMGLGCGNYWARFQPKRR